MRIVAGKHRGRRIEAPRGERLRPTADRVREAVFNILAHGERDLIAGAAVLDAFAGTGAMGLEALSRGAAHATFIERHRAALECLGRNIARLGEVEQTTVIRGQATRPGLASRTIGLAFLDPPYGGGLAEPALLALAEEGWLAPGATIVVELAGDDVFVPPEGFAISDDRAYGKTRVLFLTC